MSNRVIKESIKQSPEIDALTWFEEVLFYRLIVTADDKGRLDGRTLVLRNDLFPTKSFTEVTVSAVESALQSLCRVGLIYSYTVDARRYFQLRNWEKHQRIRNVRTKFPDPAPDDESSHQQPVDNSVDNPVDNSVDNFCGELPQIAADCGELPQIAADCGANPIQVESNIESNIESNQNPCENDKDNDDDDKIENRHPDLNALVLEWKRVFPGFVGNMQILALNDLLQKYSLEEIRLVIGAAVEKGSISIAYISAVLADKNGYRKKGKSKMCKDWGERSSTEQEALLNTYGFPEK